jgi:hypothetical protein
MISSTKSATTSMNGVVEYGALNNLGLIRKNMGQRANSYPRQEEDTQGSLHFCGECAGFTGA